MEKMVIESPRRETRMVRNGRRSDGEVPRAPSRPVYKKVRRTNMQRMKREVLCLFTPENALLPTELVFIILELADLCKCGRCLLSFTVFFPHLIKRRHEPLDDPRDENIS